MRQRSLNGLLEFLRRGVPPSGLDLLPDGELLARFAAARDEAAFELLVRRHGPMVYGVARRVLRDSHAAEDVLQATFLALARQARALRRQTAVAGWLYRVAARVAVKARPQPPVLVSRPPAVAPDSAAERAEMRSLIDEAVARLPARLRDAVILCYLSGHTTEEAARMLGRPKGTVLSRLAAARGRLKGDLSRRGVTVSAATIAAVLAGEFSPAALPPALVSLTLKAAGPAAALSATVVTLAQGAAVTMSWSKIAVASAAVVSFGILGLGVAGPGPRHQAPEAQPSPISLAAEITRADDRLEARKVVTAEFEAEINNAAERRVDLKMRVFDAEQRVNSVQAGIRNLEESPSGVAGYRLAREIDPKWAESHYSVTVYDGRVEVLKKAQSVLQQAQRELYRALEEVQVFEQTAALRLDALKRRHAALTP